MSLAATRPVRIEVSVAAPAELSDVPGIWRVASGRVELYAIVEQNGHQIGNRCFIRSAEPGDLLVAVAAAPAPPSCRWVAFALGNAVLEQVPAEAQAVRPSAIEGWIADLAEAVARVHGRRQGGSLLLPGDSARFVAGADVRAGRDVVWAEIIAGAALLFGEAARPLSPGSVVPLTVSGWITAGADGAELRGVATLQVLADARWPACLTAWQAQLQAVLAANMQVAVGREAERVQRATSWSRQTMRAAMAGLAETLVGRAELRPAVAEEPLTAVCRAVARAMGFDIPAQPVRPVRQSMGMLERIVRCAGAPARAVTLRGAWWRDELGPLIAFRRATGTPVALLPVARGRYACFDPATGEAPRLTGEQAEQLDASAYVLYPPLPDRPLRARDLLRLGLAQGRRDLALMLGMGVTGSLLGLAVPVATGVLIDEFIPSHLAPQLLELGGLLLLIVIVMVVLRITQDLAQVRILGRSANRLQPAVIDRTIRLGYGFLKRFTSADLAQRVMVIDAIRRSVNVIVFDAMLSGAFSLTSILLLFLLSPAMAVMATLLAVPFLAAATWASRAQLPALAISEARSAEASQLVFQLVDNINQLRAAGAEERAFARWAALHRELQAALLRASRAHNRLTAFLSGYGIIGLAGFFAALQRLHPAGLTVGQMVMMVSVYGSFVATATNFGLGLQRIFLLQPKLARARVLLAAAPEASAAQLDPGELIGRIEVSHVSFGYVEGAAPTLDDISLTIEPGQFVAFVGPSGSGKSTLMKLLLGFEQPQSGGIFYDGQDLKRLDIRLVRRQIGTVLQTGRLMPGSLFDNILGVTGGTNEQAWEAARLAGLAEDIEAMPMGMHTLLTDGGTMLSGGQAQRLLIARALAVNPRLIFFDEATSALDNATQAIVMQSLEHIAVTRAVIAHRLSTIRHADRIFVLQGGRIVQDGSYEALARSPGLFAELIRRQEA